MTVALEFKAFAKAIPCLTPFLATSDPSVLKRILAYIRELLARRIFSLKSDPSLYGPIVAVRLRANLEALSWTNKRSVMARRRPEADRLQTDDECGAPPACSIDLAVAGTFGRLLHPIRQWLLCPGIAKPVG